MSSDAQFTDQPYLDRRGLLMEQLEKGLILIPGAGPEGVNPNFFYLTGIPEPRGALLLAPAGTRVSTGRANPGPDYVRGKIVQQILFLPRADPLAARWGEGSVATSDSVDAAAVGVDLVASSSSMDAMLTVALRQAHRLFYVRAFSPSLGGDDDPDSEFIGRVQRRFAHVGVGGGTPHVDEMRRCKDAGEVEAIERSVAVTAEALDRVLREIRPGVREHAIEAEIAAVYRAHGAGHAFEPIVGCGDNALKLHYRANDGPVDDGRLILVDTGASLAGYKSDITRTYPVSGKFDARQREIYEAVLRAEEETIAACKPGALLGDLHAIAHKAIARAGFGDALPHGTGHHLGLETHDVGDIHRPLVPGNVITIEPGIYLADEGIGVRIEDDVLITDDGHRVLSDRIPKDVESIERIMAGAARE
ncbi:MAG: M24 family metallopeptidase [bacterium]|nr:M24 family metallopeptidase [bacterium]